MHSPASQNWPSSRSITVPHTSPISRKWVRDFDQGRKDFLSSVPYHDTGKQHPLDSTFGSKRVLNRPDARTSQVENKVDKLAEQLAELSLIVRKQTGASSSDRRETPRPCSFCQKPGHGATPAPKTLTETPVARNVVFWVILSRLAIVARRARRSRGAPLPAGTIPPVRTKLPL